ncbi:MAG: DUF6499 domain-containing protein [Albidovulum sp.]
MTPDASGWRSSTAYEHVDDMSASDLAWEWLRRNDAYDEDFQALSDRKTDPHALTEKIRQRWRLRFPGGPAGTSSQSPHHLAARGGYERHLSWAGARWLCPRR